MSLKDVTPNKRKQSLNLKSFFSIRGLYLLLFIAILIYYYLFLPPIHYASLEFWFFAFLIVAGCFVIELIKDSSQMISDLRKDPNQAVQGKLGPAVKKYRYFLFPVIGIVGIGLISHLIFSPLFMAKSYGSMIEPVTEDFKTDFPEVEIDQVPLVDRDTAQRLGNRHLGSLTDLVSQFEASLEYTQINIKAAPYRVTPLKYAGLFKWLNNFSQGIPHYLKVDNVTGKVEVMTPEKPIKYSYSDHFGRYISRHLRFNYPFTMFGRPSFEVDDEGVPYYIATTYGRNFFIREPEPTGLITVNAMTGDHQYYDLKNIPKWVDRVYSAELIMHQLDQNGQYKKGFWNALFAKEGVTETSEGYNYLPMNDDLYLYTGITSVVSDESNIGFVLVNLRTKEATVYPLSAAEEFSAMSSAEGSVQEKGYKATFPMLINLQGRPMYILTLKDSAGLIKSYSLVDVQDFQKVYIANSIAHLIQAYGEDNPIAVEAIAEESLEKITGKVDQVQAVVEDGQSVYYFMVDGQVYQVPVVLNQYLPFVEAGQEIKLKIDENSKVHSIDLSQVFGPEASGKAPQIPVDDKDPLIDQMNQVEK